MEIERGKIIEEGVTYRRMQNSRRGRMEGFFIYVFVFLGAL